MKKTISLLLCLILLVSAVPVAVFAADTPSVTLTANKTTVAAGEQIDLTVTLNDTIENVMLSEFFVHYDTALFTRGDANVGTALTGTQVSLKDLDVSGTVKKFSINTFAYPSGNAGTPGSIATISFTAKSDITAEVSTLFDLEFLMMQDKDYQDIAVNAIGDVAVTVKPAPVAVTGIQLDQTAMSLLVGGVGTLNASVTPDNATDKTITWASSDETVATVSDGVISAVGVGTATITAQAGGLQASCAVTVTAPLPEGEYYTVSMGANHTVVAGESVTIPVTIGHTGAVNSYNAFDLTFTYDASILELTSKEFTGMTVTTGEGTVRIQCYGASRAVNVAPFALTFSTKAAGTANVTVSKAYVDIAENANDKDAPEATLLIPTTVVTVSGYTVNLPENFTGDDLATPSEDYVFTAPQDYYDYVVKVTIGGTEYTGTTISGGTYTIPKEAITGHIVVELVSKTGKTFDVTLGSDMEGAAKAQYMTDYTATLTEEEGFSYQVAVTIGGVEYTSYTVADGVYTIPGADITGPIAFAVTKTKIPENSYAVVFEGNAAGSSVGGATVKEGATYTFTLIKETGYIYLVSATVGGQSVEVIEAGDTYTIENVTGKLVITVQKRSDRVINIYKYVELDGKTAFLVTVTGTLKDGHAFAYNGNAMYYSNTYRAWCFLVMVDTEYTVEDAEAAIVATETSYTTLNGTYDVNGSTLIDINDAQLVYNIYTGMYENFSLVSMKKFLNADVNGDMKVDVTDAAAVVAQIA